MKGLSCESTLIARMLRTTGRGLRIPRHSTAAKSLRSDQELEVAGYSNDEARYNNVSIAENGDYTPLTSFEHVTTAIVLFPLNEDFDTLRADIAAFYHGKVGHENTKGQNERLRLERLPTLTDEHGSLSSREPQVLNSIEWCLPNHARVIAWAMELFLVTGSLRNYYSGLSLSLGVSLMGMYGGGVNFLASLR